MIVKQVKIINKLGLHARAAAKFVAHAAHYASELTVSYQGQAINGKSIMGVMMLAAAQGAELELRLNGDDEQAMCDDLVGLIADGFGEEM